jgi:hypothetical protein
MLLGFWKSRWEIDREEAARRDEEWRAETRRYREECRDRQIRIEREVSAVRYLARDILTRMETDAERLERLRAWTRRQRC